jgi:hypothetical protein
MHNCTPPYTSIASGLGAGGNGGIGGITGVTYHQSTPQEQPKEVLMAEDNVASEELALDGDKMVALAKELETVERKITKGKTISPASMEAGTALVRARWALLGIVQESWAALAKNKSDKKK